MRGLDPATGKGGVVIVLCGVVMGLVVIIQMIEVVEMRASLINMVKGCWG